MTRHESLTENPFEVVRRLVGGEGGVCLVVGMMGTQGFEESAGEGTTSNRLLSVSSNSKLESLSWEKYYEVNIQEFPP